MTEEPENEDEELIEKCTEAVRSEGYSTSLLQRRFRLGFHKAKEILEIIKHRELTKKST